MTAAAWKVTASLPATAAAVSRWCARWCACQPNAASLDAVQCTVASWSSVAVLSMVDWVLGGFPPTFTWLSRVTRACLELPRCLLAVNNVQRTLPRAIAHCLLTRRHALIHLPDTLREREREMHHPPDALGVTFGQTSNSTTVACSGRPCLLLGYTLVLCEVSVAFSPAPQVTP